jgi:DNA-binding beta-propeller fold protein YncE
MTDKPIRENPYVGPRSLEVGERIYGRKTEIFDLTDLLIAERIVLLHSPSGAGKSSLVNAGLIPSMEKEGFSVLPPVRVNLEPPPGISIDKISNRYILSVLQKLEGQVASDKILSHDELRCATLGQYLKKYRERHPEADSLVLIFDQFEEVLTIDPTNKDARMVFFNQVGAALRDRSIWALFVAREDYIAALGPYLRPIPTRLSNTFRLDFLGVDAARKAIRCPVEYADIGLKYDDAAVNKLVNDLREVQVQLPDGSTEYQLGPYIEPVQLQVVCRHLFNQIQPDIDVITVAQMSEVGNVNQSLGQYYEEQVQIVAEHSNVSERRIRDWFGTKLITRQGIRGLVQRGKTASEGLDNHIIFMLVNTHLVRSEKRLNATWFELAHDRLIAPVLENNAAWIAAHLNLLQQQTEVWLNQGRSPSLLLTGEDLLTWTKWANDDPNEVLSQERDFLKESLAQEALRKERAELKEREFNLAQLEKRRAEEQLLAAKKLAEEKTRRLEEQYRSAKKLRAALIIIAILAIAAVAFAGLSLLQQRVATIAKDAAEQQEGTAIAARNEADYARSISDGLRETAQASELVAKQQAAIALEEKNKAEEERQKAEEAQMAANRAQGEAEEQRSLALEAKSEADKQLNARSQGLAQVAESILNSRYELSLLLSVEAYKIADTTVAHDMLIKGLQHKMSRSSQLYYESIGDDSVNVFAFSQDGRYLITGTLNGEVSLLDVARKSEIAKPKLYTNIVDSVALCRNGSSLLIAAGGSDGRTVVSLFLWDRFLGQPVKIDTNLPGRVRSLAFKPDCSQLAAATASSINIYNINPNTNEVEKLIEKHEIRVLDWSPDGTHLAVGDEANYVYIYDLTEGGKTNFKFLNRDVTGLSWHPDGVRLFTIHRKGVIELWNTRTGQIQEPFPIQTKSPTGYMDVSPDGILIAVADRSENIEIYNSQSGQVVSTFKSGFAGNMANRMEFGLLNGRLLLAHSTYNSLLISEIFMEQNLSELVRQGTPADLITLACQAANRNMTTAEWDEYFPGQEYQPTCPRLPYPAP